MDWLPLESAAYWSTFVAAFFAVALWESWRPERPLLVPAGRRWSVHGVLLVLATLIAMLVVRLTPVAAALSVEQHAWAQPRWAWGTACFLLLDLSKYLVHRVLHSVPVLWRLHRVHHADPDFDLSTALRFHPLESLLMRSVYLGMIFVLAPPAAAVLASELMSVLANFFDHANAALPEKWDRLLRRWIVTPNVHRLHHTDDRANQGKNLGELLPWWDRLFGTYSEPVGEPLTIGLRGYQNATSLELGRMLVEPFRRQKAAP